MASQYGFSPSKAESVVGTLCNRPSTKSKSNSATPRWTWTWTRGTWAESAKYTSPRCGTYTKVNVLITPILPIISVSWTLALVKCFNDIHNTDNDSMINLLTFIRAMIVMMIQDVELGACISQHSTPPPSYLIWWKLDKSPMLQLCDATGCRKQCNSLAISEASVDKSPKIGQTGKNSSRA